MYNMYNINMRSRNFSRIFIFMFCSCLPMFPAQLPGRQRPRSVQGARHAPACRGQDSQPLHQPGELQVRLDCVGTTSIGLFICHLLKFIWVQTVLSLQLSPKNLSIKFLDLSLTIHNDQEVVWEDDLWEGEGGHWSSGLLHRHHVQVRGEAYSCICLHVI